MDNEQNEGRSKLNLFDIFAVVAGAVSVVYCIGYFVFKIIAR